MTVLGKIRERSGLLVSVIAIALLIFILEQALESKNSFFSGDQKKMGEVNGKNISIDEYQSQLDIVVESQKEREKKANIDENTMESLRNQVWNQLVFQYTMEPEYNELGIAVSVDELDDMVRGKDPHPSVKQAFTDPANGKFDPAAVTNFLKNMDKDETGATKQRWLNFEDAVIKERISTKFNNLVKGGLYVTKSQAKQAYIEAEQKVKFTYVLQRYGTVQDSSIKVTDEDLQKCYNENKNKYKQVETTRSIVYVAYDVAPSQEDMAAAQEQMNRVANDFKTAAVDSDFVNANSDNRYSATFFNRGFYNVQADSTIEASPVGFVYGPVSVGNTLKIVKVTAIKMVPDTVKARHILIKVQNGNTAAAKAKADSLKGLLKNQKFEELAKANSEDPGSAVKGGDLGWFREGMMVKPFNDACFNGKVGDVVIVESQFGMHLIEITGRGVEKKKVEVATIDRLVQPSSRTFQGIYSKASDFAGKNTTSDLFDSAVVKQALNKIVADNIRESDRNLPGLESAREVVRWVYSAKKGDVSKVFELNNKYIIAKVSEIKEKGILPLETVKAQVELEAKKEKKAEQFITSFKSALKPGITPEQLASKFKTTAEKVENQVFLNTNLMGVGREGNLIGNLFTLKTNVLSAPIKGDAGVYVVQVNEITPAPPTKDYKSNQTQAQNSLKQRVDYELFDALKEKADVQDNRAKFY